MNGENITDNSRSPIATRIGSFDSNRKAQLRNSSESNNIHNSPFLIKRSSNQHQAFSSNSQIKNFCSENPNANKIYTPSPNNSFKGKLSDRFIPANSGINLLEKFEIAQKWENQSESPTKSNVNVSNSNEKQMNTYSNLLQNNFFNNTKSDNTVIKSKIFEFKSEAKKKQTNWETIMESCDETESFARKISTKPYKILEAPGLIDDFYLNLVDWSSNNDIAVGLNNSVYLWCANKTQVVNLLNYTGDKYVSSVIWNN